MWQPIETAPRNQTFLAVLNCAGEQTICTMRWPVAEAKNSRPDSETFHVERVTHWMPLPDPPGAQPAPSEQGAHQQLVTSVYPMEDDPPEKHTANMRLIAAAPDLLEALQMLLEFPSTGPATTTARAAIAKAIGE